MGISIYEAHQACKPLVLNTAGMDGSHWDGLKAKAMQNHSPNFLTARATPQKLTQLTVQRKTPLICDVNGSRGSWNSSLPLRSGAELCPEVPGQHNMHCMNGWGIQGSMLAASALQTYRGPLQFMVFLKWEDDGVQMVSMCMYNFAEKW